MQQQKFAIPVNHIQVWEPKFSLEKFSRGLLFEFCPGKGNGRFPEYKLDNLKKPSSLLRGRNGRNCSEIRDIDLNHRDCSIHIESA